MAWIQKQANTASDDSAPNIVTYWQNTKTGETSWTPPEGWSDPLAGLTPIGEVRSQAHGLWGPVYRGPSGEIFGTALDQSLVPVPWDEATLAAEIAATQTATDQAAADDAQENALMTKLGPAAIAAMTAAGGAGLLGTYAGGAATAPAVAGTAGAFPPYYSMAPSGAGVQVATAGNTAGLLEGGLPVQSALADAAQGFGATPTLADYSLVAPAAGAAAGAAGVGTAKGALEAAKTAATIGGGAAAAKSVLGGEDKVGSDWAIGQPTGPIAGTLPTDENGQTLPNLEAGSTEPGGVNSIDTSSDMPSPSIIKKVAEYLGVTEDTVKRLGGAAIGAIAAGLGGGSKPAGTTSTVQDIPDWLKPYVVGNLDAARAYMAANPQDNSLVAPARAQLSSTIAGDYLNSNPANPFYTGAMDYTNPAIANLAKGAAGGGVNPGSAYYDKAANYTNASMGYLTPFASGEYVNKNPYIDALYAKARDAVGTGIDSRFSKAGRYGSGAHQGVLGTTFGNLATDIYGQNYANERANQLSAAGTLTQADLAQQAARLAGASGLSSNFNTAEALKYNYGQAQTAAEQAQQAARITAAGGLGANYNTARGQQTAAATAAPAFTAEAAAAPFSAFGAFGNLTKQNVQSVTSPYFSNTAGNVVGGALTGAAIAGGGNSGNFQTDLKKLMDSYGMAPKA